MQVTGVSIGIKALNEERHIADCLRSVCAAADALPFPVEVILADSGSTDRTIEIARQFDRVRIVRLAHPEERSCGAGAQAAFQTATGRYFYLLDGDMELQPGFLEAGIAFLEANPGHAGVGGIVREANTSSIEFAARARNDLVQGSSQAGDTDRLDCGGLYRTSAVTALGYFADRNLRAFEEFELGARLAAAGWRLARIAVPAVIHNGHSMGGGALIWRRISSGYAGGTGQVLTAAWRRPHLVTVLRRHSHLRHGAVVVGWWVVLAAVLGALIVKRDGRLALVLGGLLALPLAYLSRRRRSIRFGAYSLATWTMHGVGLIQGLLQPRQAPERPIDLEILQQGHL